MAPRLDRDDTLSNASLWLYIIFISEALWDKRAGLVGHCLASLLSLQPLSNTQLRGPGGGGLGLWSDGVSSPSHISDSPRPACPQPVTVLSLSVLRPLCSATPQHHSVVDIRSDIKSIYCTISLKCPALKC